MPLADFLGGYNQQAGLNRQADLGKLQEAGLLQGILAKAQEQQQMQEIRGALSQSGGDPQKAVQTLVQMGTPQALTIASHLKGLMPKPAEPYTLGPDQTRFDAQGNPVAMGLPKEKEVKPPSMRTRIQGETSIQEEFDPETKTWKEVGKGPRFAKSVPPPGGYAQQGSLDPVKDKEALRDLAVQSLYDPGSLAGFRRDTKTMGAIQRERIQLMKEMGVSSEDVVSGRAGFKADTGSLNKLTPQYDAITAFEKTAIRNGKILVDLAEKVDTTGVPVVERWIRAGRKEVAGDADVAKFQAQMNLYRAEAARILTQPNLSGVLTDTARKEMEDVIRGSASAKQIKDVVGLLERDFENRKQTLEEQIGSIRARMRSRVAPGGGSPAAPVAAPAAPKPAPAGNWTITPVE